MQRKKVGELVQFQILRDGKLEPRVEVKVESMEEAGPAAPQIVDLTKELGLKVKDGDSKDFFVLNKTRGWRAVRKFILITEVSAKGPLYGKVKPGDVLVAAGKDPEVQPRINSVKDLQSILTAWKSEEQITFQFWRDAQTVFPATLTR